MGSVRRSATPAALARGRRVSVEDSVSAVVKIPARVETIVARLMGWQAVRHGRDVLQRYDDAAGGLLAGGLTYSALFALLPCLLLLSGVLGLLVSDPVRQQGIVSGIGDSLPPLRGLVAANVASMAHGPWVSERLG
jgi:hypothetical protein